MISSLSNFLNNSIASLSIYDVFIIILFALVLILCIVSGVIIVSSKVKKIDLELNKNKSIQEVQDKIITNRLDLILNKLGNKSVSLNNLTNKDIKNAVINNPNEEESTKQTATLEFANNEEIFNPMLSNEIKKTNSDIDLNTSENIYVDSTERNNLKTEVLEHIDIDQENLPKDINLESTDEDFNTENSESDKEIIDINEKSNKKSNIFINTAHEDLDYDENDEIEPSFEKGKSIPLKISNSELANKNQTSKIKDQQDITFYNDIDEEQDEGIFNEDSKTYSDSGIILANKILNNLKSFSNEEKFEVTNFISDDGKYITNIINNRITKLTKKELIKQLFILSLVNTYNYPIDDIEDNYDINLRNNTYQNVDIVVFNEESYSHILVLIDATNKNINSKLLTRIARFTLAPFIIWTDGNSIIYYKNNNGVLKEISDIPQYEESIYANDANSNSQFIAKPLYSKNYISNNQKNFKHNNYTSQNQSQEFSKDMYNIFRKQPYSLSDEYKSIISQYKNFSSTYNKVIPVQQPYSYIPTSSNFLQNRNNNFSSFNNYLHNNLPIYNNHIVDNNPSTHFSNNTTPLSFNPGESTSFSPVGSNGTNLDSRYNNQIYDNSHNIPFRAPEVFSNVNFADNFPEVYRIPNYIRFNNYNMYP